MLSTDSSMTGSGESSDAASFTIAVAEVISSLDALACGRVQVQVPWLQDTRPWARVALPGAGGNRGTYAIPHPGDEVLVAFNRNDVTDCFVIGGLWNSADPPPRRGPLDPLTTVAVRSEVGHEVEMDDIAQSVTISTSTGMTIKLGPTGITLSTTGDTASIELTATGDLKLSAAKSISLDAPIVDIGGTAKVNITSNSKVAVDGGLNCTVQALKIALN